MKHEHDMERWGSPTMINNRFVALAAVSLAAVVAATSGAHAGAFAVREQSATAQGMSFAGAASGSGGVSSMFWNPATVTMKPGWNSEFHASFIIPESTINPAPGTSPFLAFPPGSGNFIGSGDLGKEALVPASYTSYQLSDNVWLGLSTSAPFGLVTKPEPVWSGQIYARTSKVFSLNLNPIVGVKLTDWLSVAAGPAIQYLDVRLRSASSFLATAPTTTLEGDDVGVGATAGALLTLPTNTQIGVGFRSAIRHELWGEIESQSPRREVPIEAKLTLPEIVTVGLSQAFTPYFRVHAGFEWTNWSRLSSPDVIGPVGLITELVLNYKDGYFYSGGAEYDLSDRWTIRAGVAYEDSPITTENRTPRLPDNDRVWASLGATYKWNERLSFDLAYTHIFVRDSKINIGEGRHDLVRAAIPGVGAAVPLPFVADAESKVDIISAALKYRWDTPVAPAVPVAPIVRKY
jgi:long-chain fatty acid transport protein